MRRKHLPRRGAPIGNQNARKHGYYSKRIRFGPKNKKLYYLPNADTLDIELRIDIAYAKFRAVRALARDNIALAKRARGVLLRLAREQKAIKMLEDPSPESPRPSQHTGSDDDD